VGQAYKSRRRGRNYNRYDRLLHWRQRDAGRGGEPHCGFASWSARVKNVFFLSFFFPPFGELVEVADGHVFGVYVFGVYTQRLDITEMLRTKILIRFCDAKFSACRVPTMGTVETLKVGDYVFGDYTMQHLDII
jgi:hypothetical protein